MNVLMMTDIEGCAGVVSFETDSYPTGKYYEAAKKLLTAEVNAAVQGLVTAGVEEVLVLDMHGPGGIAFEDLKAPAKVMHGRPLGPRAVRDEVMKEYDTAVIVGPQLGDLTLGGRSPAAHPRGREGRGSQAQEEARQAGRLEGPLRPREALLPHRCRRPVRERAGRRARRQPDGAHQG